MKDMFNYIEGDELKVLRHALNIARLRMGNYYLDDKDRVITVGLNDVDYYIEAEEVLLNIFARGAIRKRESSYKELMEWKMEKVGENCHRFQSAFISNEGLGENEDSAP